MKSPILVNAEITGRREDAIDMTEYRLSQNGRPDSYVKFRVEDIEVSDDLTGVHARIKDEIKKQGFILAYTTASSLPSDAELFALMGRDNLAVKLYGVLEFSENTFSTFLYSEVKLLKPK